MDQKSQFIFAFILSMIKIYCRKLLIFLALILLSCGGGGGGSSGAENSLGGANLGDQSNSSSNSGSSSSSSNSGSTSTSSNSGSTSTSSNSGSTTTASDSGTTPTSSAAIISVLYNPASASSEEQNFINSGLNIPGSQFTDSNLIFMTDIQSSEVEKAKSALEAAADIFGHYDIYFYGLGGDLNKYNSEIRTSACNLFGYSDCETGTMQYLRGIVTSSNGNAGANINGIGSGTPSLLIYQGTNGGSNISQLTVIHEYVHIFQHASMLGMGSDSERKSPVWFTEGMAQYIAEWLGREKGYSNDSFAVQMANEWDNAYSNRNFHVLKDQIDYISSSNPKGLDGNKYGQAMWAIAYMIELASQRIGVTNGVQVILNDLVSQIRDKGWESAFFDNVGLSVESFYTDFNALIEANDKTTRLSNLETSNVSSIYVPTHNYSILQLTGASTEENSGGSPVATKKTIYFFNSDNSQIPSYQGSDWPFVIAEDISKPAGISAEAEVFNGYVQIKTKDSDASRPVYQYVSDNDVTSSGNLISGWSSINVNGSPISASVGSKTNIVPSINDLPSDISVNENQTTVVTISASDNDYGDSLSFSVSGLDSDSFGITNQGVLSFQSAPDFETKNSYNIDINLSDGLNVNSQNLTINISNVNESPSINGLASSIIVAENQTSVTSVSASDPDAGTNFSFSLTGTDASALSIDSSGVITFNSAPDYVTKNSYNIIVNVSDGALSDNQAFTINVSDVLNGSFILGNAQEDQSGAAVSLNSDGTVLAIGSVKGNSTPGHVKVFDWNENSSWEQRGSTINGVSNGDNFGYELSLSSDGNVLAVLAFSNNEGGSNSGEVKVYSWDGSSWTQRGIDFNGAAGDLLSDVSLNSDGTILAIGAAQIVPAEGNGKVSIYSWNGSTWVQRGSSISGEALGDKFGHAVSLSSNGNILATGAYGNNSSVGHARVHSWNGSAWVQLGADIDGSAANGRFADSLSLNSDGTVLAIGAESVNSNTGQASVYAWNGSAWIQRGNNFNGTAAEDRLGKSISISSDASIVAIGSQTHNDAGSQRGETKIYSWNGSAWSQIGSDIHGEVDNEQCGYSLDLNSGGSIIAVGCRYYSTPGLAARGRVRVFQYD